MRKLFVRILFKDFDPVTVYQLVSNHYLAK